ncbi:MraY family glycosyltransferase [Streptomyces sp. AK02-04a]|uniref:MraY family glycosyltransferase n=1 Tax=Streptomyces sp. AK02-04a TaxID=3028649 RepID=UPI0029A6450B|nr:MraY family glycosyltransferase [Streptomyces sp. AK02-04a]MDX3763437.1 MraY family glycosyltransferase [Streptomyces sp. AK02-04a]
MTTAVLAAAAGGAALLLGLLLTEPLRRLALRRGITDRPSARKAHTRPTPYLGGIAVAVATLAAGSAAAFAGGVFDPILGVLLGGAAVMCVLGLIDDLRPLGPALRLGVEASAAAVVVLEGGHPALFGGIVDVVLAVVWIVFVTNAFNLLDNMDGAASSLCAIIGGFVCLTALSGGPDGLGVTMAALTGACLGFLFHNKHPARIFLGDSGSLFLGFTLASAMMVLHGDAVGLSGPVSLLLATLVPTLDTTLVMLSRYRESRPLLQGGTDHIAHRLQRLGMTVGRVVGVLGVFAVTGCLSSMLVTYKMLAPGVALAAACVVGIIAVRLLLKAPANAALSPGLRVSAETTVAAVARSTVRLRTDSESGRRHRQLRPMAAPHTPDDQRANTRPPTTGAPSTPQ